MKTDRERVLSVTFLATTYNANGQARFNVPKEAVKLLHINPKRETIHLDVTRLQSGEQFNSEEKMKSGTEIYKPGIAENLKPKEQILVRVSRALRPRSR